MKGVTTVIQKKVIQGARRMTFRELVIVIVVRQSVNKEDIEVNSN